ncbi:MAG: MFS transporter, partial [Sulfobacillus benefaciens]
MQKPFTRENFPAKVGPLPFLGLALISQTGMSFVQQGLVVLGVFFAAAYHLDLTDMGFITTALSLGVMVSMVFVGLAVDRVGPRMVLFWGALLMAVFTAALLVVHSYSRLLAVLFLVGMSLAIAPSAGTKAVFSAFAGRPRGLVMGIRQTGVPIGAALAAFLLPRVVPAFGLSSVFVLFSLELLVAGWA